MTEQTDPPVRLKGVGDSLWVTIDPALPMDQLQAELNKIFQRLNHLAVGAKVVIDPGEHEDCDQLIEDLGGYLKVTFQVGQVSKPHPKRQSPDKNRPTEQDQGNLGHSYRSDVLMIAGRVRSGQTIEAEKHLVILGDLNPGAEAVAGGDILILGSLQGKAVAGQPDNHDAIIMALEFKPTQIQIAKFVVAGNRNMTGIVPEFAYVENSQIMVDDYIKNNPFKRINWPEVR